MIRKGLKKVVFLQAIILFSIFILIAPYASARPESPENLNPGGDKTIKHLAPSLKWNQSGNIQEYEVKIYKIQVNQENQIYSETVSNICQSNKCAWQLRCGILEEDTPYIWRVWAKQGADRSRPSEAKFHTPILCDPDGDSDCDGIPDKIEDEFHTNKTKKTLFIRPVLKSAQGERPWTDFYTKLFPKSRGGLAEIPGITDISFKNACTKVTGIEVVVIGAPDTESDPNPHTYMRGDEGFAYEPGKHPGWPCSIMEIVLIADEEKYLEMGRGSGDTGHIFFSGNKWNWSTPGKTSNDGSQQRYGEPNLFRFPLDRYFDEGAYDCIQIDNKPPPALLTCSNDPIGCRKRSPSNLVDANPFDCLECGEPPLSPCVDDTVEINPIAFDDLGKITMVGEAGKPYDKNQVLAHLIVHEMGHALTHSEHCQNQCCIMYEMTLDFEFRLFGQCLSNDPIDGGTCEHSAGMAWDIRSDGIIYNRLESFQ